MIPVSTTKASSIQYVLESDTEPVAGYGTVKVEVEARPWPVTDEVARASAAEEQLGEGADEDEYYAKHAMWFIDAEANAAALCVFRPKVEQHAEMS